MNRILIFRYDLGVRRFLIHDGFYSDQNNLKSFKFRKGMYLLMPTSGTNFNIFFNPEYKVSFQKAKREEIR